MKKKTKEKKREMGKEKTLDRPCVSVRRRARASERERREDDGRVGNTKRKRNEKTTKTHEKREVSRARDGSRRRGRGAVGRDAGRSRRDSFRRARDDDAGDDDDDDDARGDEHTHGDARCGGEKSERDDDESSDDVDGTIEGVVVVVRETRVGGRARGGERVDARGDETGARERGLDGAVRRSRDGCSSEVRAKGWE